MPLSKRRIGARPAIRPAHRNLVLARAYVERRFCLRIRSSHGTLEFCPHLLPDISVRDLVPDPYRLGSTLFIDEACSCHVKNCHHFFSGLLLPLLLRARASAIAEQAFFSAFRNGVSPSSSLALKSAPASSKSCTISAASPFVAQ